MLEKIAQLWRQAQALRGLEKGVPEKLRAAAAKQAHLLAEDSRRQQEIMDSFGSAMMGASSRIDSVKLEAEVKETEAKLKAIKFLSTVKLDERAIEKKAMDDMVGKWIDAVGEGRSAPPDARADAVDAAEAEAKKRRRQ